MTNPGALFADHPADRGTQLAEAHCLACAVQDAEYFLFPTCTIVSLSIHSYSPVLRGEIVPTREADIVDAVRTCVGRRGDHLTDWQPTDFLAHPATGSVACPSKPSPPQAPRSAPLSEARDRWRCARFGVDGQREGVAALPEKRRPQFTGN